MNIVKTFLIQDDGVTALEYGMIAALIAAVIVVSVKSLGTFVKEAFTTITAQLAPAA